MEYTVYKITQHEMNQTCSPEVALYAEICPPRLVATIMFDSVLNAIPVTLHGIKTIVPPHIVDQRILRTQSKEPKVYYTQPTNDDLSAGNKMARKHHARRRVTGASPNETR